MEYSVEQKIDVELSNTQLFNMLKERIRKLSDREYKMISGKLFRYERVSWNDYDYVEVNNLSETVHDRVVKETKDKQDMIKHISKVFGLDIHGNPQ